MECNKGLGKKVRKVQVFNRILTEEDLLEYSNFVKLFEARKIVSQRNISVDLVLTPEVSDNGAIVYFSNQGEPG